jgi:hypothetical protein
MGAIVSGQGIRSQFSGVTRTHQPKPQGKREISHRLWLLRESLNSLQARKTQLRHVLSSIFNVNQLSATPPLLLQQGRVKKP